MSNFALGSYMPMDSVVHKMDPRSKIIIMLLLMISILEKQMSNTPVG